MLEDEFCDIIKKARTGVGLEPNQVARDAGLSTPALRELEAGQRAPTPEEVNALAAALRLDGAKLAAIACDGWHPRHPIANTVQDVITIHGDIGGYAVKGYLYHDPATRQAVLIDTGYHPEAVLRAIEQHRLTLTAICLTHGHADHARDRKSTRLNSSHGYISYAVFCLKKKKQTSSYTLCKGTTSCIHRLDSTT